MRSCRRRRWLRGCGLSWCSCVCSFSVLEGVGGGGLAVRAFACDQFLDPPDLALGRLEAVPGELLGVRVEPFPRAGHARPDAVRTLLEPAATPLEDAQAHLGVGLPEEREVDAEVLVLPRRGAGLAEQVGEALLAVGGELVDDLAALAGEGRGVGQVGVGLVLGDPPVGLHVAQCRVQRAVGQRPEAAEQGVEPLAQLVPVQRRLLEQAENGELEDASPLLAHHGPHRWVEFDVSNRYIETIAGDSASATSRRVSRVTYRLRRRHGRGVRWSAWLDPYGRSSTTRSPDGRR